MQRTYRGDGEFCVSLTVLRATQIAGKTLFMSVSVKVFLEEILESAMQAGVIQFAEGLVGAKRKRKADLLSA
jgi:hypothetical protein